MDYCIEVMTKQVRRKYKTQLDELYKKINRFRKKSLHEYILDGLFALNCSNQKAIGQVIKILRKIMFVCVTKAGIDNFEKAH